MADFPDQLTVSGLGIAGDTPEKVLKRLEELIEKHVGAVGAALYQEGLAVEALAVKKTPVDTGRLRATHYVAPPEKRGTATVVEAGFGTDYAVYVHERVTVGLGEGVYGPQKLVKHNAAGTEPKFLENAVNERTAGFAERLARRAAKNVRDGILVAVLDPAVPTSPQDVGEIGPAYQPTRATKVRGERAQRKAASRARRHARKAAAKVASTAAKKAKTQTRRDARRAKRAAAAAAAKLRKAAKRDLAKLKRAFKDAASKVGRKINRVRGRRSAFDKLRRKAQPKDFDF